MYGGVYVYLYLYLYLCIYLFIRTYICSNGKKYWTKYWNSDTYFVNGYYITLKKALTGKISCASVSPLKGHRSHLCCSSFRRIWELVDIIEEMI